MATVSFAYSGSSSWSIEVGASTSWAVNHAGSVLKHTWPWSTGVMRSSTIRSCAEAGRSFGV
ncbi:hypothetical protein GY12_20625 [Micrococcus luteus]|nr:hypothetical protein GY12_20625 [Micrococcus luteus]